MRSSKCAHTLKKQKQSERVRAIIAFTKTASTIQLTARLLDSWAHPHGTITEVRLLLTLGANPKGLYQDGAGKKTLLKRIENGTICTACAANYEDFLKHAQSIHDAQFGQTPIQVQRNKRSQLGLIALSLDGGGMRGLVSVVTLMFASRRLFHDLYLPNVVDWMVGTSTGSMLALTLAKGASLMDAFFLYWEMKDQIFLNGSTMKRLFGNIVDRQTINVDKVLSNCFPDEYSFLKCSKRLTVPALDISKTPARLHVFRNYNVYSQAANIAKEDVLFRDAARASSAAPTYFHPHFYDKRVLVDGSFVANCPLNILFKEFDQCNAVGPAIKLAAVISIGTGEPSEADRKYKNGKNLRAKGKSLFRLFTLMLEQVVGHEQAGLESAKDRCLAQQIPFLRISPKGIHVRIDQIDDTELMEMIWKTLVYLKENDKEVDRLGEILKSVLGNNELRRVRSNTAL